MPNHIGTIIKSNTQIARYTMSAVHLHFIPVSIYPPPPNDVQFQGSLNFSSSFLCGLQIHLMHKPTSMPIKNQLNIIFLVVLVQIHFGMV